MVKRTCEVMSLRVGGCRLQILQTQATAGAKQPVRGRSLSRKWSRQGTHPETKAQLILEPCSVLDITGAHGRV
jgi:hypothetical protein